MNRFRNLSLAMTCVAALSGCALFKTATAPVTGSPVSTATQQAAQLELVKSELVMETAYSAIGNAYISGLPLMNPEMKARAKAILLNANEARLVAERAETLGDNTTIQAKIVVLQGLLSDIKSITSSTH